MFYFKKLLFACKRIFIPKPGAIPSFLSRNTSLTGGVIQNSSQVRVVKVTDSSYLLDCSLKQYYFSSQLEQSAWVQNVVHNVCSMGLSHSS